MRKFLSLLILLIVLTIPVKAQLSQFYKRKISENFTLSSGAAPGLTVKVTDTIPGGMWMQVVSFIPNGTSVRNAINSGKLVHTGDSVVLVGTEDWATFDFGSVILQHGSTQTPYRAAANTDVARGNAIVAAFAASAAGDNIIIGNGNYSISTTLTLKASQTIILEGANITSTDNTKNVFTATDISNWKIKGKGIITGAGSPSGGVYTNERGVYIHKSSGVCSNWEISGLTFTNFRGCAIFSDGSSGTTPFDKSGTIHDCYIYGNNFGIYLNSPSSSYTPHYIIVSNNIIHSNNNFAVYITGGNNMVSDNTITSNYGGIYLGNGYNHAHGVISNNEINHNTTYGIHVYRVLYGETVIGNHILVNDINVYLDSCLGINIDGGMIYSGISYDIKMNGTPMPGYNYITNVYTNLSAYTPMSVSATIAQRAKLIIRGCTYYNNSNPDWNNGEWVFQTDTTNAALKKGNHMFNSADSSVYVCRSTTAAKKWYKIKYE